MARSDHTCLACGGTETEVFLELDAVPVFCNVLHDTADKARAAARGDMVLVICRECAHVFNASFDESKVVYGGEYENSLHHSPRFQEYADALAAELAERYALAGQHVVEIASGQGDFLRMLCERAGARGTGYDPSYVGDGTEDNRVRIVAEPFDEERVAQLRDAGDMPRLVLSRQALEHFEQPHEFLRRLGAVLPVDTGQSVFFEVPNSLYSLEEGGIWDFIYEHVSYFCAPSLAACFRRAGFDVVGTDPRFGGQFLSIDATWPGHGNGVSPGEEAAVERIVESARALGDEVRERTAAWRERLDGLRADGRTAVVWGAGSKGVTFLNLIGAESDLVRVVDINPRKTGMHVAGVGTPIEHPDALRGSDPALVVVMNPLYTEEIRGQLRGLGIDCEMVGV